MIRIYKIRIFALFICLYAVLIPQLAGSQDTEILVNIGTESITDKELMDSIEKFPPDVKERFKTDAGKEDFLRELVRIEVFSKEAKAIGMDKDRDFQNRLSRVMKTLLASEYIKKEVIAMSAVSEDEAKSYYENNLDEFKTPEKFKISQIAITLPPDATPEAIKGKESLMKRILQRVKEGEDFVKVAKEFSEDAFKGEPEYYSRGAFVPEIEDEIFKLKIGEITPILEIKDAFLIFKLLDRVPEGVTPFKEVKAHIIQKLKDDKKIELFMSKEKELFSKYNVIFNPTGSKANKGFDLRGRISNVLPAKGGDKERLLLIITVRDEKQKDSEASVTVTSLTKIFKRSQKGLVPLIAGDIKTGQIVEITFKGPAIMTYPMQAYAEKIVIIK